MKWEDMRPSDNVEERSGGGPIGFGGGGMRLGGGAVILVIVVSLLLGKNPLEMLALLGGDGGPTVQTQSLPQAPPATPTAPARADPQREFVARAYVIAHEVGHHVQNQLGLMDDLQRKTAGASERVRNEISVRQELQADCLAGVWGNSAAKRNLIDARDVESGIAAAMAVGDDRLQQRSRGYVVPEAFTHGSSEQRAKWFKIGLVSGDIRQCNTFASRDTRAAAGGNRP